MVRLFGTDGIRGTTEAAASESRQLVLTPELLLRIGHAAGVVVRQMTGSSVGRYVVVGRDPRASGVMLEAAVTAGLVAEGFSVIQAGVIPTPGIAFLARRLGASIGAVISASHNPVVDNGIKFFGNDGYKLPDEWEDEIEGLLADPDRVFHAVESRSLGRVSLGRDLSQIYVSYLLQSWCGERDLSGYSVFLECANGATSDVAPEVFRRLGCNVTVLGGSPDGLNINETYEYINPARFAQRVVEAGADVGIAFDGDGDRVILVDERGDTVDGDAIMGILARYMQPRGLLPGDFVVTTQMSNYGLHESLEEVGIRVAETAVGDKYVMRRIREDGGTLGGERSGHILIFDRDHTTGDGIYTALAVLAAMVNTGEAKLSELAAAVPHYPQFIESVAVPPSKPSLEGVPEVQDILEGLKSALGSDADIVARYSGTEDKLRLSVRCHADGDVDQMLTEARGALRRIAGVISGVV
jgi:phosphoglucosamine mutase